MHYLLTSVLRLLNNSKFRFMWPISAELTQLALFAVQLPYCINAVQFISTLTTIRADAKQEGEEVVLLLHVHREGT